MHITLSSTLKVPKDFERNFTAAESWTLPTKGNLEYLLKTFFAFLTTMILHSFKMLYMHKHM